MKFCKVLALYTVFYGSKTWVLTQREMKAIHSAEMKLLKSAGLLKDILVWI
jgi:hypothetical protein